MAVVKCPSCGSPIDVPEKQSALPWIMGCLVAFLVIPVIIAIIGLLAAIAIPSFVKARSTSQLNACINNMRYIDSAKEQWAMEVKASTGQAVDTPAVNAYIRGATTPLCPAGGTYDYRNIGLDPECSVHGSLSSPKQYGGGSSRHGYQ